MINAQEILDDESELIILAIITCYDIAGAQERTFYYSNIGYTTEPYDIPPAQEFADDIAVAAQFSRHMFSDGRTGGITETDNGYIELSNSDGELDYLKTYAFDGWSIQIKLGTRKTPYTEFVDYLNGSIETVEFDTDAVTLRIKSKEFLFDIPIQENLYVGSNSGTNGNEGLPEDIKGQPKVLALGKPLNCPLVRVNTPAERYQGNDGQMQAYSKLYDDARLLTPITDYSVDLATGIVDLVSPPAGVITADIEGITDGGNLVGTFAEMAEYIGKQIVGLSYPQEFDTVSFTKVAAISTAILGLYITTERTCVEAMDEAANSVGGWWGFTRTGKLQIGLQAAPTGISVLTLEESDTLDLENITTQDEARGIPFWRLKTGYDKNHLIQNGKEVAGTVTQERVDFLKQPYRYTTSEDVSIKIPHKRAGDLVVDSAIVGVLNAMKDNTRRFSYLSTRHERFRWEGGNIALQMDIGDEVTLINSRFGLQEGKNFIVYGIEEDPESDITILDLHD